MFGGHILFKKKIILIIAIFILFSGTFVFSKNYFSVSKKSVAEASEINSSNKAKPEIDKNTTVELNNNDKSNADNEITNPEINKDAKPVKQVEDRPLYNKEVFLTLDDGPSNHTEKVLNILNENNVKATFFIVGKMAEEYPNMLKAIRDNGMSIQNHSYTHDYSMYQSVEKTNADFSKCDEVIKSIIGKDTSPFIRFPGGSDNGVSKKEVMAEIRKNYVDKGRHYIDWNISSTDGSPNLVPTDKIIQTVDSTSAGRKFIVILMHDANAKTTTVEALPSIIKFLKNQGYTFRTFDDLTPTELNEMLKEKIADR